MRSSGKSTNLQMCWSFPFVPSCTPPQSSLPCSVLQEVVLYGQPQKDSYPLAWLCLNKEFLDRGHRVGGESCQGTHSPSSLPADAAGCQCRCFSTKGHKSQIATGSSPLPPLQTYGEVQLPTIVNSGMTHPSLLVSINF